MALGSSLLTRPATWQHCWLAPGIRARPLPWSLPAPRVSPQPGRGRGGEGRLGPRAWPAALFLPASVPQQRPKEPLGRLERLAESSSEFQAVVQAFCDTLDTARGRIHVVRVRPLSCCLWPLGLLAHFALQSPWPEAAQRVEGHDGQGSPGFPSSFSCQKGVPKCGTGRQKTVEVGGPSPGPHSASDRCLLQPPCLERGVPPPSRGCSEDCSFCRLHLWGLLCLPQVWLQ